MTPQRPLNVVNWSYNWTPRAQQVMALALKETDRLHHDLALPEHLLLGLIRLDGGTAVNVLENMGIDLDAARVQVEMLVGIGSDQKKATQYSPRVKRVLALGAEEARALEHTYIGTEHILLGLLVESEGGASRVLKDLGVDIEKTRVEILKVLGPNAVVENAKPSEKPQDGIVTRSQLDSVDTSKRYDIYCIERNQQVVVYRNALFKCRRKLLSTRPRDFEAEFVELEQSNGQVVYLSLRSVDRFCQHGVDMVGEVISAG